MLNQRAASEQALSFEDLFPTDRIVQVIEDYAGVSHLASGMVRWTDGLAELTAQPISELPDDLGKEYEHLRVTPVVKECLLCRRLRQMPKGNTHCFYSDALYANAAHERGEPVLYRCHAGLIDFVYPVRVGTYHKANIYGGQIVLVARDESHSCHSHPQQDLAEHAELARFVVSDPSPFDACFPYIADSSQAKSLHGFCSCDDGITDRELEELAGSAIPKTPEELSDSIKLLRDIADLLSAQATEAAVLHALETVEEKTSEILMPCDGIKQYLEGASQLVSFDWAVVVFYRSDNETWSAVPWAVDPQSIKELLATLDLGASEESKGSKRLQRELDRIVGPRRSDFTENVPMRVAGRYLGVWVVGVKGPKSLRQRAAGLLRTFAAQAGTFLQASNEIRGLGEAQLDLASFATHPDEHKLPQAVTQGVAKLIGSQVSPSLWIYDNTEKMLEFCGCEKTDAFDGKAMPVRAELDAENDVLSSSERAFLERACCHSNMSAFPDWYQETVSKAGVQSILAVPLSAGERSVGVLNIHLSEPRQPTPHQVALLEAYGRSAAHAIQTWQLCGASQQLDACQYPQDIQRYLQRDAHRLTGARYGCLWVFRDRREHGTLAGVWGFGRDVIEAAPPRKGGGIIMALERTREPICAKDIVTNRPSEVIADNYRDVRSWLALPLLLGGTEFLGALFLDFDIPKPTGWGETELTFLDSYAGNVAAAVDRVMRSKDLRCQEILATDNLQAAAAAYANETHLATIDESIQQLPEQYSAPAKRIERAVVAIRAEVSATPATKLPSKPEDVDLRPLVAEQWTETRPFTTNDYGEPKYSDADSWPSAPLQWPRPYLRRVIEATMMNTVRALDHAVAHNEIAIQDVEVHINCYDWEESVQLTIWSNCATFSEQEIDAIERDQQPIGAHGYNSTLREAGAILHRAGGSLHGENANGALVRLAIPKRWTY